MKKNFISILLILSTLVLCSQDFSKTKMDSLFSVIESNQRGMGSISIFKNGNEVYQKSFGFADVENSIPATKNTTYRIGSVSKSFTASIIMQLIEEGKLNLDTRLTDFYPEIPNAKEITIAQLLRHRSGLYNFTNAEDYPEWMEESRTRSELIETIVANGTVFEPNEKSEYSNTNYVLLSLVIEKIENKDYSDILSDRITTPMQLNHTYYGGKIHPDKNEALSYTRVNSWELASETDMSIPIGAGAIVSNPTDLNAFYAGLFNGKIVSENSLNEMKSIVDQMGIGMFQMPFYERIAFGHNGGIDGFQSNTAYFPDDGVSISYTTNGVVMSMNDILIGALSIYYGKPYELPEFKPGLELKSEDLDQYLGVYSKPDFPLKVTISKKGNVLIGQATGQSSFPLEAYEKDKFKFDQASLKMDFIPEENLMILRQGGQVFELKRED